MALLPVSIASITECLAARLEVLTKRVQLLASYNKVARRIGDCSVLAMMQHWVAKRRWLCDLDRLIAFHGIHGADILLSVEDVQALRPSPSETEAEDCLFAEQIAKLRRAYPEITQ